MLGSSLVRGARVLMAVALSLVLVPLLTVETIAGLIRRATSHRRPPRVPLIPIECDQKPWGAG